MPERLEIQNQENIDLKKQLEKIDWPINYGSAKVQIRNGKVTLLTLEQTIQ